MKRLFITLLAVGAFGCALSAFAYENPGRPTGFVNDFAGIFSSGEKATLEAKLSAFEKATGAEISVVSVKSLGGDTAQNFGTKLFEDWAVGKKGADNGILFLIAPVEHEVRIEVGYGLEPTVTDGATSVIIRELVLPAFKEGKYFEGVDAATGKIMGLIQGDSEALQFVASSTPSWASSVNWEGILILLVLIILLSTRRGRRMLPYLLWSGIGRGGNSGGGSSGGFGGFGGGRSGGGGAGGKW